MRDDDFIPWWERTHDRVESTILDEEHNLKVLEEKILMLSEDDLDIDSQSENYLGFLHLLKTKELIDLLPVLNNSWILNIILFVNALELKQFHSFTQFIRTQNPTNFTNMCIILNDYLLFKQEHIEIISGKFTPNTPWTNKTLPYIWRFTRIAIKSNVANLKEKLINEKGLISEFLKDLKFNLLAYPQSGGILIEDDLVVNLMLRLDIGESLIIEYLEKSNAKITPIKKLANLKVKWNSSEINRILEQEFCKLLSVNPQRILIGLLNYQGYSNDYIANFFHFKETESVSILINSFTNKNSFLPRYINSMEFFALCLMRSDLLEYFKYYFSNPYSYYRGIMAKLYLNNQYGVISFYRELCNSYDLEKLSRKYNLNLKDRLDEIKKHFQVENPNNIIPDWVELTDSALAEYLTGDELDMLFQLAKGVSQRDIVFKGRLTDPNNPTDDIELEAKERVRAKNKSTKPLKKFKRLVSNPNQALNLSYIEYLISLKKQMDPNLDIDIPEQ